MTVPAGAAAIPHYGASHNNQNGLSWFARIRAYGMHGELLLAYWFPYQGDTARRHARRRSTLG